MVVGGEKWNGRKNGFGDVGRVFCQFVYFNYIFNMFRKLGAAKPFVIGSGLAAY